MEKIRKPESRAFTLTQEQTYLARIRYTNQLPEPLCPPKLLAMPTDALPLVSRATFTPLSLLTKKINVDVDAECGMSLDGASVLVVNTGTEKVIPALNQTHVHPTDRLLLRTTDLLRKSNPISAAGKKPTSFLRRTEYISADGPQYGYGQVSTAARTQRLAKAKLATMRTHEKEYLEPTRILRAVLRGFDTANPDTPRETSYLEEDGDEFAAQAEKKWKPLEQMTHPDRLGLTAVAEFPLLPDLEACSDTGGFMVFSFSTAPVPPASYRDTRMDAGILVPQEDATEDGTKQTFDYYLPATRRTAKNAKLGFSCCKNQNGSSQSSRKKKEVFKYKYLRTYETRAQKQTAGTMAVVLHNSDGEKPKGAYYYPIDARFVLQAAQKRKILEIRKPVEVLNVSVRELHQEELTRREEFKRARVGF